ncbi:MAG: hypothetical protein FRX49_12151 [Trebouxia sp. A1-2]|nr:MAG: hypothetical protein FRX49_12151 [Trebouxia sp. A1-2]
MLGWCDLATATASFSSEMRSSLWLRRCLRLSSARAETLHVTSRALNFAQSLLEALKGAASRLSISLELAHLHLKASHHRLKPLVLLLQGVALCLHLLAAYASGESTDNDWENKRRQWLMPLSTWRVAMAGSNTLRDSQLALQSIPLPLVPALLAMGMLQADAELDDLDVGLVQLMQASGQNGLSMIQAAL